MQVGLFERVLRAVRQVAAGTRRHMEVQRGRAVAAMLVVAVAAATLPTPGAAETTGPAVAHVPVTTAAYGQAIPMTVTSNCAIGASCSARLFYRTTMPAALGTIPGITNEPGFTVVGMTAATVTPANDQQVIEWRADIPGSAATTRGVDYFFEIEQNGAITHYPGTTHVDANGSPVSPTGTYFHIMVLAPPLLNHAPVPIGFSNQPITIDAQVSCSSGNCQAELWYHRTGDPNPWTRVLMGQTGAVPVGATAVLLTYTAAIPGWSVDTRGVDYYIRATDGQTQAFSPGTPYQGYYAPTDGVYSTAGNWHVHVLEAPRPVHAPVVTAPYRQPVSIDATSDCPASRTCTATLYYRTTTADVLNTPADLSTFASTPMSVSRLADNETLDVVSVHGVIPASVADTRGVDYLFSVSDGVSTAWFPGTSAADGPGVWVDGTHAAYQHIRIQEPPHFIHATPGIAEPLKPLRISTELTCATESCNVQLHYSTVPGADITVPMERTSVLADQQPSRVEVWEYTIPAGEVTTRGISYYMTATDGYTNTAAPGTFYWGAYVPTDGGPVVPETVRFIVRVVDPPHPVHVPVGAAFVGQEIPISAASNCATNACTATLHWRVTNGAWQAVTMLATLHSELAYSNDFLRYEAIIGGTAVTTAGIEYRIEITDGFVTATTPTYPVVVTDPPPVTTTSTSVPITTTTTIDTPTTTSTSVPLPTTTSTSAPLPTTTSTSVPLPTTTTVPAPDNSPPSQPSLVAPLNGSTFAADAPQLFTINATDPDGDPYTGSITVTNTANGQVMTFPTAAAASGMDSSGSPTPPLASGTYSWRARATDAKGESGELSTSSWTFTVAASVNQAPDAPTLVAPADESTLAADEPQVFSIRTTDPDGDAYTGQVRIRNAATNQVIDVPTTPAPSGMDSSGSPVPPLAPGSYTWTASATDPDGLTTASLQQWSFTVAAPVNNPPDTPTIVAPEDNKSFLGDEPQGFVMTSTDSGGAYHGVVTVRDATTGVVVQTFATSDAVTGAPSAGTPSPALAAGRYTFTAVAVDPEGLSSAPSAVRTFEVLPANGPPTTPQLVTPANDKVFLAQEPQLFSVNAIDPDMDLYNAEIEVTNTFTGFVSYFTTLHSPSGVDSAGTPVRQLPQGLYSWRARAVDADGLSSDWSGRRSFTVANLAPAVPTLVSPELDGVVPGDGAQVFTISTTDPEGDRYTGTVYIRQTNGTLVTSFPTVLADSGAPSSGVPLGLLAPGTYQWSASATDTAGATSGESLRRTFIVATPNPPPLLVV